MVDNKALQDLTLAQVPQNIITYVVQSIILIYQDTHNYVFDNFEKEQAIDLLFHERRNKIESFLKLLPNRFPAVSVDCKINASLTCHHVEVKINDFTFTQSFTQSQSEKVRDAKFRNDLSKLNLQTELEFSNYPKKEPAIEENSSKYYAILHHGADGRTPQRPEFFEFIFPSENSENIASPIDILKLYNISANILRADIEEIKSKNDLINPSLKKPAKTDEGDNNESRTG